MKAAKEATIAAARDASRSAPGRQGLTPVPTSVQGRTGNRGFVRLIHANLQPKLTVSHPQDAYEQEADRVADEVMRMPESGVAGRAGARQVQRFCPECEEQATRQAVDDDEVMASRDAVGTERTDRGADVIWRQEGPQSFAPAEPGTEVIDPLLQARNLQIEQAMLQEADALYASGDLRWFFAYAHGKITEQINGNLARFQRPNALLRLNIHFAEEFMRAIYGQPHAVWQRAFRFCGALQTASEMTPALVGEAEFCGAAMANVHINVDLAAALREVGCIPPADYGNMLVFVNRGALAAQVRLRGRAVGAAEAMLQQLAAPMLGLEVRAWRNAAYQEVCNTPVPGVEPGFMSGGPR